MDQNKFRVNLKRTGMDTRGFGSATSSTSRTTRTTASIHTPLKPANVSDLKAMFDSNKSASGTSTTSSSGKSSPRSSGATSPRSGTTSPRSGGSSPGHSALSAKKSDSGTSLTFSVTKSFSTNSSGSAPTSTSASSITSKSSASRDNGFPSRINITTTSSASETLTKFLAPKVEAEKSVSGPCPWSPKEGSALDSKISGKGLKSAGIRTFEKKTDSSTSSTETRVEIPVHHVTSSSPGAKSSLGTGLANKSKFESTPSRFTGAQGVTTVRSFQTSGSLSGPNKKTATSSSTSSTSNQFKSSLDKNKPASASAGKKLGSGTVIREIPVERVPSAMKTENSKAQRSNDKLRASLEMEKKSAESKVGKLKNPEVSESRALAARQLSNERFERLKFDFERGVPTESQERRGSGPMDHIELQIKARELHQPKDVEQDKPKKEESIFAQGMKVSDFVKHINTVHPPPSETEVTAKKWKKDSEKKTAQQQDSGGENQYIEMPDEESDQEGIYEFVGDNQGAGDVGDKNSGSGKTPGRRQGVYRKEKGRQASGKVKKQEVLSGKDAKANGDTDPNDSQEIVISSGEDEWDSDHSGSTNYEPVDDDDNLYEDPDALELNGGKKKKDNKEGTKSLGNKLKKNVDKATNYLNKKFNKKKTPKDGNTITVTGGAGTDSEGDVLEDEDAADMSSLSRTSSERSSGQLTRGKDKPELSVEVPKMQGDEDEKGVATPPPPPLPPRASKVINQPTVENSPPLPPRNPMVGGSSLGVNLDVVVPITPPPSRGHSQSAGDLRKKSDRFSFGRDSYLGGQEIQSQSQKDVTDSSMYELARPDSYLGFDPASPRTLKDIERKDKSVASSGQQSPRSAYVYPDNISDWPQLTGDSEDEELYIELADDQIYGRQERPYSTKFDTEPLYQWYAKDHIIRANRQPSTSGSGEDSDVSGDKHTSEEVYEDVERLLQRASTRRGRPDPFERNAPARRSVIMDVFGKSGSLQRALWCEMPEVIKSGILGTMDPQEKKVQESMFEIMTSEASYLKSLNVLINVFVMAPEFSESSDHCIITKRERQFLFSNIGTIRDISAKFLADLEARWQESCVMNDICDIIAKHAEKNFEPYIRYCSNQAFQERALETLQKRSDFFETVKRLEQNSECQFLPMSSFLLLPMQRITRLPLLVDAIRHRLDPDTKRHKSATTALDVLNRVVKQCNEGAKKMLQTEQMCLLAANIEFSKVKEFPLVSSSRYLVKQGELNRIVTEGTSRLPFGKKGKEHVFLFLFSDILLITKKRGNVYQVRDYCQRNSLHVEAIDSTEKSKFLPQGAAGFKNLFLLALLSNHEGKQVEMVLSAKSESERTRWLDAILPQQHDPEYERIYEDWDCPQVQCVEKYIAQEPDELTLEESDVINVFKKMADGWYEGERIRDGERGWFPADHTEEINNFHVRARNLRLRYRLMIASQE